MNEFYLPFGASGEAWMILQDETFLPGEMLVCR
jgi:hypothetical protein